MEIEISFLVLDLIVGENSIYGTRALDHMPNIDYTNFLFENRLTELYDFFK